MAAPTTTDELIELVRKSGLVAAPRIDDFLGSRKVADAAPADTVPIAQALVFDGLLTKYQAEQLLAGRWRNFVIGGKYKLLERLGRGGMAMVFLCEHQVMKRLVALKILPLTHGEDRELLGRFHREARALSQLRHPNIVGAYDVDQANKLHFLVMEYVDGGDLDQIVRKVGPLPYERAAHYIRQAARGLQHAHESGLVHRDVKPGNLLVDRAGTVKLLDLGLARIFHETTDDLTTGRDARTLLGTVDYLAPEQALNSHDVDIRADIYGLGATFYFLLTGRGLFQDGTVAQKLSWHLHRPPTPISEVRPDIPTGLVRVLEKMIAKRADDRYQSPEEVEVALLPWTQDPIPPPADDELPKLSRAAKGVGQPSGVQRLPASSSLTSHPSPSRVAVPPSKATLIMPSEVSSLTGPPSIRLPATVSDEPVGPMPAPMTSPAGPRGSGKPGTRRPRAVALVAGGAIALGAAGAWALFGRGGADSGSTRPPPGAPGALASGASPERRATGAGGSNSLPADAPADAQVALVTLSGQSRPFSTIREAARAARPGDRLEVKGRLIREAVTLSDVDGIAKDLTIEGIAPGGGPVRWRGPRDLAGGRAILDVSGLEGLRVRGFVLDGQGTVAELVRLSGRGAGSTLEDIQVVDPARAGVVLRGWSGESDRPAGLRGVRFSTGNEAEAALLIEPEPDRRAEGSRAVRVASCRFVGPFGAAILIAGPVSGLDVERCRFFRATDGVRYKRTEARGPLGLRLANNTFVDLQRGFHLETTPPAASSEIAAVNNLFLGTPRIATLDRVSVQPPRSFGRWIWTDEGKRSPSVPAGDRMFRKSFDLAAVPEKAMLDIGCDETFTVWVNGEEVGRDPADHFSQRIFAFEVAPRLRKGRNVIAVKGTNQLDRIDPKWGTTAGLLAQVVARQGGRDVVLAQTDGSWKSSDGAPEGWTRPDFDDAGWNPARPWPDSGATWPWMFPVWDSAVLPGLKAPLEPIRATASGNVRDYKSWEGYPILDSERVVFGEKTPPRDPDDDATFLRLPRSHPLYHAGPGGTPVGVFDGD